MGDISLDVFLPEFTFILLGKILREFLSAMFKMLFSLEFIFIPIGKVEFLCA